MNYTLQAKSSRWLSSCERAPNGGAIREFCIALRPCNDQPNPAGQSTIEHFFNSFDISWQAIVNALAGADGALNAAAIEACLEEKVYLFAPALNGDQWHDMLILLNISLPGPTLASCIICMDAGVITHTQVQY